MKHNQVRQVVFPIITAMIWGSSFVAQSTSTEHIGAFTFNAARSFVGFLALLVVVQIFRMVRKEPGIQQTPEEKKAGRKGLVLGGICCGIALALACNLQQLGMVAGASAGKTSFITTLYVVLVPICGLFLKKRVSPTVWISVLLAVAGLYCLCIKDSFSIAPSDLLVMLCAFGYTLHILVIDYFTQKVDGVKMSCIQFLSCAVLSAILMLIFEHPTWADITPCIGSILYVGVFSSGVAYTLQILGQRDLNPAIASLIMCLESVFSALGGWMLLHQNLSAREVFGCVLIFAAVVLAQLPLEMLHRAKKTT